MLVAAMIMGMLVIMIVGMGVFMRMRLPVGMGCIILFLSGGARKKDACQSIFIDCLHYTRTGAICKEHEIGKIIPRGGIETQIS